MTITSQPHGAENGSYDRASELKAFDETKAGVKGVVDSGITKIPRMFIQEQPNYSIPLDTNLTNPPVIDLQGFDTDQARRVKIVDEMRSACEEWGFFQVINHGIPVTLMEEMLSGIRSFHEQDVEVKKEFHSRDFSRKVLFNSNFDLYVAPAASWRDTLTCVVAPVPPHPHELPSICRDVIIEYTKEIKRVGTNLFELLSETLGLKPDHLKDMGCADGLYFHGHYYPACPEPELAMGTRKHVDSGFLTLLLQDQIGGLQLLHDNKWVEATPIPGALVVNVGDLFQLITNDKYKSVQHRVVAKRMGPRISVAYLFRQYSVPESLKLYRPIKELLTEENPPVYREISVKDFMALKFANGFALTSDLADLKL